MRFHSPRDIIMMSRFVSDVCVDGLESQRDVFVRPCLESLWCFGDCVRSLYAVSRIPTSVLGCEIFVSYAKKRRNLRLYTFFSLPQHHMACRIVRIFRRPSRSGWNQPAPRPAVRSQSLPSRRNIHAATLSLSAACRKYGKKLNRTRNQGPKFPRYPRAVV
jgi:hypothetical protein